MYLCTFIYVLKKLFKTLNTIVVAFKKTYRTKNQQTNLAEPDFRSPYTKFRFSDMFHCRSALILIEIQLMFTAETRRIIFI